MDEKQLQALYDAMQHKLDLGSFNDFKSKIYSDSKFRKAFYGQASEDLDLGDFATFDQSLKKKESPLSSIGSAIGSIFTNGGKAGISKVQSPDTITITPEEQANIDKAKEQPFVVDEKDPIKSFNNAILAQTIQFKPSGIESTGQKFLSPIREKELSKTENLNKILPSQSAKLYEQVKASAFPNTKDAVEWLQNNPASQTPDNETAKLANQKIERRKTIDELAATSPTIEDMVSKLAGKNISDMSPVEAGRKINNFLNQPEVIEKADEGGKFLHDYNVTKGTLINKYPEYGLQKVATELSQKLEDEKMTGWLYSNPGVEKTDKSIQMLYDEGKLTEAEKNIYNQALRPIIEAGGADQILKTSDLAHAFGRGIYSGVMGIGASARDISNKVTGGVFQNLGLLETDEDRTKRLQEEQAAQTELIPRKGRKGLVSIGEFTGFTVPMILGNMAKVPQALNAVLMFEGNRADKSRELFPEDKGKQSLYTLLGTTMDAALMSALPTKKAGEGVKNLFEKDILNTIDELSTKKITEETAKNNLLEKFQSYIGDVAKGNIHTANVLTAFQMANNGLDAAFGKRDFNLENEISDALREYKTNFLIGTPLSMLGAIPKSEQMNSSGRVLREMADNPDLIRDKIKDDPDKQRNLEKAILINDYLKERPDLSEERKNRFMGEAMRESALNEKEKATTVPILKEPIKKEIKESQIAQQIILDPEMGNKKIVQEFFDNDLLPKGSQMLLSDENGKFSEHKVGAYLKYLAQQENNLDENWQPESKEKISKATKEVPEQLKEIANERWKDEIEKAKSIEEKVTPQEEPISTPTVSEKENVVSGGEGNENIDFNKGVASFEIGGKTIDITIPEDVVKEAKDMDAQQRAKAEQTLRQQAHDEYNKQIEESTKTENQKTEPQLELPQPETKEKTTEKTPQQSENQPPEPPIEGEKTLAEEKQGGRGITHVQTKEIRNEFGLGEYEKHTESFDKWDKEADERIRNGEMTQVLDKIRNGEIPSAVETRMMGKYIAELANKVEKSPTDENLNALHEAVKLSDSIGGSEAGRTLVSRKGTFLPNESLASFFEQERVANMGVSLTESQKETVQKEYKEISSAEKAYNDKIAKLEEENARLKAEKEIRKTSRKKEKKDYSAERKQIIEDIRTKLKKARGETTATIVPYAKELIAIAPDVAKLVKNLVEEGTVKLAEVAEKVYEELKDHIPAITKKDVNDLIAGEYNEKKQTRNELAKQLFELRQQAQLVNKLEKLNNGEEPKSENKKRQRNLEIEKLKNQIKEHDLTKLAEFKKKTQSQIEKLEKDIKEGNFEKPEKKPSIVLDKEARELQTKMIRLKTERQIRIMKEEYANRSRFAKFRDALADKLNIPRTIMSSMDYSAPLRQGLVAAIAHPRTAGKAAIEMFRSSFSQNNFDRWMYEMRENPRYETMQKSGLSVTDPHSPYLAAKEEAFMNNTAEKIPVIGKLIKGSERAYVMFLNKMRVDLFNRFADRFEERGKTIDNSKELYKSMAQLINAETGRGDLGKALDNAAPILNSLFFSPRLIASRVNLLTNWANPHWYKNTPKEVRLMYAKDMLKTLGVGISILALSKLNGAEVEDDPRSTDFGKIKIGNTRWDIWGGFQQYIRLIAQLSLGQKKSTGTGNIQELGAGGAFGEDRGKVGGRFFRGKLAPVPSMLADWISGRTTTGEKVTLSNELEGHLTPLLYQDIKDAWKDQGVQSIFTVGVPSAFGVGVQTYFPREKKTSTIPKPKQPKKPSKF